MDGASFIYENSHDALVEFIDINGVLIGSPSDSDACVLEEEIERFLDHCEVETCGWYFPYRACYFPGKDLLFRREEVVVLAEGNLVGVIKQFLMIKNVNADEDPLFLVVVGIHDFTGEFTKNGHCIVSSEASADRIYQTKSLERKVMYLDKMNSWVVIDSQRPSIPQAERVDIPFYPVISEMLLYQDWETFKFGKVDNIFDEDYELKLECYMEVDGGLVPGNATCQIKFDNIIDRVNGYFDGFTYI